MGLFGNPRKNIDKWAKLVVANAQPDMKFDEKFLDAATTLYIQQHARILYDSIRLVLHEINSVDPLGWIDAIETMDAFLN